ncbi:ABC transporter permease [Mesorhizobium sp. J428]|uniref:ABC transporter permease n=1 Tax=Mesorhizobium sp. J428 TaxID=2898440 RepID=UPI0021511FAC|nr:ABC transporter permease [Mesorhizobium sp. J428]MCR5858806.1 ABC transporter permease [Mesorhizobium sp. J428]
MKFLKDAVGDFVSAFRMRRIWLALANEEISDQHRRTSLGPFWLLINYLIFVGTFVFIIGRDDGVPNYTAYVALGLLVWFYIMETMNSGVSLFVREEAFIKGTTLPLSLYVLRMTMQALMRAGYAALGCVALLFLSGADLSWCWLWSAAAILLIILVTPAAITIFAFLGAFFPDSQFIVQNLTRIGMFLTPVFWAHTGGNVFGVRGIFYYWNPFTYFLEIVRVPILAGNVPVRSFILCLGISLAAWLVALVLYGRLRRQVVFML